MAVRQAELAQKDKLLQQISGAAGAAAKPSSLAVARHAAAEEHP